MPLGRGLSSLIPQKIAAEIQSIKGGKGKEIIEIPINLITPNPKQPREQFDHQDLEELIESIKEHGILQPLLVSDLGGGNYELIAGERRLRSAKIVGLKTVPAIVREVKELEKLELALIENIQRQNLNAIEEAKAYKYLNDELKMTHDEIAKRLGKSRPQISNILRLLELAPEIQRAIVNNKLPQTAARRLIGLTFSEQKKYLEKILAESWSVRQVEAKTSVKKSAPEIVDPNIRAEEEKLRDALGTKVSIQKLGASSQGGPRPSASGKGKIIIEFYSDEDRVNLIKKLSRILRMG